MHITNYSWDKSDSATRIGLALLHLMIRVDVQVEVNCCVTYQDNIYW